MNVDKLVSEALRIVSLVVSAALLLLIASAVLVEYGVRVASLPKPNPTALLYLCGAWLAYRWRA